MVDRKRLTPTPDYLVRKIRELEQAVKALQGGTSLQAAAIGAGGLTIQGGAIFIQDVNGNPLITLDGSGLTATAAGRIGNAELASPSTFARATQNNDSTNLAGVSAGGTFFAIATVTVPDGFSTALLTCQAIVGNSRKTGSGAAPFYMTAWVGGPDQASYTTWPLSFASTVQDGASLSMSAEWERELTGLTTGTSIVAGCWGAINDGDTGWVSGGANGHTLLSATFLR
jgi:hypothetical protein